MINWQNTFRTTKTLIMALLVVFVLSACSSKTNPDGSATTTSAYSDENMQEHRQCWQKDILSLIYENISKTVMAMNAKLSTGALPMVMMGFAVWLSFRLMKFLSSISEENSKEIWTEIITKGFLCLMCGLLASSTSGLLYTMNTFIFPVYNAFLEFGSSILDIATSSNVESNNEILLLGERINVAEHSLSCKMPTDPAQLQASATAFPSAPREMMECMICALASRLTLGIKVAFTIMSGGTGSTTVTAFLVGGLIFGCFTIVWLSFVFYLIDSIIKFGVMLLLLPILIIAFPFGPTKSWTAKAFVQIMSSAVFLMTISIMITTALLALIELINSNPAIFNPENPEVEMKDFSVAMMSLMIISFLIVGVLKISTQLTGAIINAAPDTDAQQKLKAVGSMVLGWVTGGMSKLVSPLKKTGAGKAVSKVFDKKNAMATKLNQLAGKK